MTDHRRVAVVTGARNGIGAATATVFASAGYAVVLVGRRRAQLDEVATLIASAGGRALSVPTDVGDPDAVARLFDVVKQEFSRVDVLFNNAATTTRTVPLHELSTNEWLDALRTNISGAFFCTKYAIDLMLRQDPTGGRIVNNGSLSAHVPRPGSVAYTTTKHAMSGLTRSTALDYRSRGIACGQIDIGNAATDRTNRLDEGVLQADGTMRSEPRMSVESVARAVLLMADLPLEENIAQMTVMATGMPYVGRG